MLFWGTVGAAGVIGTATVLDGNTIRAFGHPFTGVGPVDFPLSGARVEGIASSPFGGVSKIAFVSMPVLGRITDDRIGGISGMLGETADTIPVETRIAINGGDYLFLHNIARVPRSAEWSIPGEGYWAGIAAMLPLDKLLDSRAPGSATVIASLTFDESPEVAEWSTRFSSPSDVSGSMAWPLMSAVDDFLWSDDFIATIRSVAFEIVASDDVRQLTIEDMTVEGEPPAEGENQMVEVGGTISVRLTTRPYLGLSTTRVIELVVPEGFPEGPANLEAGMDFPPSPELDENCNPVRVDSLDDAIGRFNGRPRAGILEVRLTPQVEGVGSMTSCTYMGGVFSCETLPCGGLLEDGSVPPMVNFEEDQGQVVYGSASVSITVGTEGESEGESEAESESESESP